MTDVSWLCVRDRWTSSSSAVALQIIPPMLVKHAEEGDSWVGPPHKMSRSESNIVVVGSCGNGDFQGKSLLPERCSLTVNSIADHFHLQLLFWSGQSLRVLMLTAIPGTLGRTFKGHTGVLRFCSSDAQERVIITGGRDGTVRVWNPQVHLHNI